MHEANHCGARGKDAGVVSLENRDVLKKEKQRQGKIFSASMLPKVRRGGAPQGGRISNCLQEWKFTSTPGEKGSNNV